MLRAKKRLRISGRQFKIQISPLYHVEIDIVGDELLAILRILIARVLTMSLSRPGSNIPRLATKAPYAKAFPAV